MSKLPPLPHWCESGSPFAEQMQAYATAATEPLLQRIAELEQRNRDLYEDVQRFRKHAMNEKAARMELERQLEEARKHALEEAAKVCDELAELSRTSPTDSMWQHGECAAAIRALKGAKE